MSDAADDKASIACPVALRDYPNIVLGHGGGGRLSADLVEHLFLPALGGQSAGALCDSAVVEVGGQRLALATDSFVVRPLQFPGGGIGELAVNGTVNDLAMSGARPLYLTAAFIVEEGLDLGALAAIAEQMGAAARAAGVPIVTGDTKVVERGHGDGCYVNTTGLGVVAAGVQLSPCNAQPGDAVLISGTIGDHGMAVMSVREGLAFEAEIESDTAPLHTLVAQLLAACSATRVLRDPTRGGVASSLNEIATSAGVGIVLQETAIPVAPAVQSACEFLGLDPLSVANEGKLIAIVPHDRAEAAVAAMRAHPQGVNACMIGGVTAEHPRRVVARTAIGASRVLPMPIGEQLPRIC